MYNFSLSPKGRGRIFLARAFAGLENPGEGVRLSVKEPPHPVFLTSLRSLRKTDLSPSGRG